MRDIIIPKAPYIASFAPLSKAELEGIRCHFYINLGVTEDDLKQLDEMFMRQRAKPQCFSTSNRGSHTFHIPYRGTEVAVDWRVYCTWANTFHLRFMEGLKALGIKHSNPHIHPDHQFNLATWMERQVKSPKPLAECDFSIYKATA